jgi:hypothetical protein
MPGTRRSGPVPDHETQATEAETLTLDEIIARHRGEWVLMRVTRYDEDHWPAEGSVVAHASSQEELLEAEERAPRATPGQPYYSFLAVPHIKSGPIYEAAVKRFFANLAFSNPARHDRTGR